MSPLTQGRGLKPLQASEEFEKRNVAPHAGAWIETGFLRHTESSKRVAPHAGAWIETSIPAYEAVDARSRPLRRGVD